MKLVWFNRNWECVQSGFEIAVVALRKCDERAHFHFLSQWFNLNSDICHNLIYKRNCIRWV